LRLIGYFILAISVGIKRALAICFSGAVRDRRGFGATPAVFITLVVEERAQFHIGVIAAVAVLEIFDFYIECVDEGQDE
jgi:hypothetical protein